MQKFFIDLIKKFGNFSAVRRVVSASRTPNVATPLTSPLVDLDPPEKFFLQLMSIYLVFQ